MFSERSYSPSCAAVEPESSVASSRRSGGGDCLAEVAAGEAEGEEGAADEVEADVGAAAFEHGDARLAGADELGELLLRQVPGGAGFL